MKQPSRPIELLAPAKDLFCGMEAINHGADAVYIGAPRFSARAAAGNSVEDIRRLCEYAHPFNARVYVAFNTILKDEELKEAEQMIRLLYEAGADALIVQDMGILELDISPIPLHASTQTDNRSVEKVRFLEQAGFSQVVLARELTLPEIRQIASSVQVPLEVFIHGALCVSYSGQCYLSAALGGRSANRGECAQYCRLPYRMTDADGKEITAGKHLLSLKDMNRTDQLEALLDAGVTSFKIEGRLKDLSYVKNITAWYRQQLDRILERRPEYHRMSAGRSHFNFTPRPDKSFNRGFTSYFLSGKEEEITSFDTPKSKGEPIGKVKEIKKGYLTVSGLHKELNNGDGVVYFNERGELTGFRVNRAEENRIYPLDMPGIRPKTQLYRNYDIAFEKLLSKPSAERKIPVRIVFRDTPAGFSLQMEDASGHRIMIHEAFEKEVARKPQHENMMAQLGRLGNTIFEAEDIKTDLSQNWFIPSSLLASMKRLAVERLLSVIKIGYRREVRKGIPQNQPLVYPEQQLTYLGNVANQKACQFYRRYGVTRIDPAFELKPVPDVPLMFTRHCLKYSLGWCPSRQQGTSPYKEPFYLHYKDTRLLLRFDCRHCRMLVYDFLP
ncbi:MAG: U32 family peptidase [Tannerellaceae bacterium]|nr:U32 family peptidase [Tannerellaceae bacterium]